MRHQAALLNRILAVALGAACAACGGSPSRPSGADASNATLRIDSITPNAGSTSLTTEVTIRGSGFVSGATVSVGTMVLASSFVSPGHLNVSVPPQPSGAVDVVVKNPVSGSVRLPSAFRFEVQAPTDPVSIRLSGQVLAGDFGEAGVSGATVRLLHGLDQPAVSAVTDDEGRFVLAGTIERSLPALLVSVDRSGLGYWTLSVAPETNDAVVLRLPDLRLIRVGRTLRGNLTSNNALWCTFESIACWPVIVEGPPGSLVDLELIAEQGQVLGLFAAAEFLAPREFPKRITVPPGSLLLMGDYGWFTLKAHAVPTGSR